MADPFYVSPREQISQGDIYLDMPTLHLEVRPVRVARLHKAAATPGARETYGVHLEKDGQEPQGGFHWNFDAGGELVLARSHRGHAILLSHDCEIDADDDHRTLAMVRPITDLSEEHRQDVLDLKNYAAFPLAAQDDSPSMVLSYVDFRRVTTVRPAVLSSSTRHASVTDDLRKALAERYWLYLFRRLEGQ